MVRRKLAEANLMVVKTSSGHVRVKCSEHLTDYLRDQIINNKQSLLREPYDVLDFDTYPVQNDEEIF